MNKKKGKTQNDFFFLACLLVCGSRCSDVSRAVAIAFRGPK